MDKMKSTGIVRKIDDLGRIVLPKELRRILGIKERDQLAEWVENDFMILEAYNPKKHEGCIIRKVDDIGRIVLPKEMRSPLNWNERDPLEIFARGKQIALQKYNPSCIFCGSPENVTIYKGKEICANCKGAIPVSGDSAITQEVLELVEAAKDSLGDVEGITRHYLSENDPEYQAVSREIKHYTDNHQTLVLLIEGSTQAVGYTITEDDTAALKQLNDYMNKRNDIAARHMFSAGLIQGIYIAQSAKYVKLEEAAPQPGATE